MLAAQDLLVFYQRLCLDGEASDWEPKKLRYRLLHTVGRLIEPVAGASSACSATGPGRPS